MKAILQNKKQTYVLTSTTILFTIGILAFIGFNKYFMITQTIGFVLGLLLFMFLIKKTNEIIRIKKEVFLLASFIFLLLPLLLNEYKEIMQEVYILGGKYEPLSLSIHGSLWAIAISLPYFASFFTKKKQQNYTNFLGMVILFDMMLLIKSDFTYFILFNTIIITALIIYKPKIKRLAVFYTSILILIFITITIYNNKYIIGYEIGDLKDYGFIINSDYYLGESFKKIILNFSLIGEGINIDVSNYNSYKIQDHVLVISILQFGFVALSLIISLLIIFFENIISTVCKKHKKPHPLQLFAMIFLLFQISIGFIHNLDLIPYLPNYGIPFYSYSGLNLIIYFIAIYYIFGFERKIKVLVTKSSYSSSKQKKTSSYNLFNALGIIISYFIFVSVFLFIFVGMGIVYNNNNKIFKPKSEQEENVYSGLNNDMFYPQIFFSHVDSVLIDTNGVEYNVRYNLGDSLFPYLAAKNNETGKWSIWDYDGNLLSELKFDSIKGKVTKVSEIYEPFTDRDDVAHPEFMRACNLEPDIYTNEYDVVCVMIDGKWGIYTVTGEKVISCIYDNILNFIDYKNIGDYAVGKIDRTNLYIDIYSNTFSQISPYHIQQIPMDVLIDDIDNGKGLIILKK